MGETPPAGVDDRPTSTTPVHGAGTPRTEVATSPPALRLGKTRRSSGPIMIVCRAPSRGTGPRTTSPSNEELPACPLIAPPDPSNAFFRPAAIFFFFFFFFFNRGARSRQDLSRAGEAPAHPGARRPRSHRPRGHDLRPGRPQRGRQVHHRQDPHHAGDRRRGHRDRRGDRHPGRPGQDAPRHRRRRPALRRRPGRHRPGEPVVLQGHLYGQSTQGRRGPRGRASSTASR